MCACVCSFVEVCEWCVCSYILSQQNMHDVKELVERALSNSTSSEDDVSVLRTVECLKFVDRFQSDHC